MRHNKVISISSVSRECLRREIVNIFLDEEKGTGKGDNCSHYDYVVEILSDGYSIHIRRPAPLNKGFDFIVFVPGINFHEGRQPNVPSHNDIIEELRKKIEVSPELKTPLREAISRIYDCQPITKEMLASLPFSGDISIEIILATIKWLFIEQDITYWNWTGRDMFYSSLSQLFK